MAQSPQEQTPSGNVKGQKIVGTLKVQEPMVAHFENTKMLESMGFVPDQNLAADGPGSSIWGYKNSKTEQILMYSYRVSPTSSNPNEPLQFNCPCDASVSIFISDLTKTNPTGTELANPASTHCANVGGTLEIKSLQNGAQYELCMFNDNMACEEWALMRGNCPVGGVRTTGYDNMGQMYCAWLGGQTTAVTNSKCTLPDGTICSIEDLYQGICPSN